MWDELLDRYVDHIYTQIRSTQNLLGLSPHVVRSIHSRVRRLQMWRETHLELITPRFVNDQLDQMERNSDSRSITNHLVWLLTIALGLRRNELAGLKF